MSNFIWILVLISLIQCHRYHIDAYVVFLRGVKDGLKLIEKIFPVLMALTLWINLLKSCGIVVVLERLFSPVTTLFHIPVDIVMICLLRPLSSQVSLVMVKDIYLHYGVDHVYSLLASCIYSNSDTTCYVVSLYSSVLPDYSFRRILCVGLVLDFFASVIALLFYFCFIM